MKTQRIIDVINKEWSIYLQPQAIKKLLNGLKYKLFLDLDQPFSEKITKIEMITWKEKKIRRTWWFYLEENVTKNSEIKIKELNKKIEIKLRECLIDSLERITPEELLIIEQEKTKKIITFNITETTKELLYWDLNRAINREDYESAWIISDNLKKLEKQIQKNII